MQELDVIALGWEAFAKAVMLADVGLVQRQEMRRAFYAGAWVALTTFAEIGDDSVSENQGVAIVEGMVRECEEFLQQIKAGSA